MNPIPTTPTRAGVAGRLVSFFACMSLAFSLAVAQTPLVHYTFDEGSGTIAANSGSLGSGSDLTLNFSNDRIAWTTATPGGLGSALQFTGGFATGYAAGNAAGLNTNLQAFTITMWVNVTDVGSLTNGDRLLGVWNNNAGFDLRFNNVNTAAGTATLALLVDGADRNSTSSIAVNNGWAFVAVSYDGSQTASNVAFYNGGAGINASASQLGSLGTLNRGQVDTLSATAGMLQIGSSQSAGSNDRTPPAIFDDVRIYSGVLDATQIEAVRLAAIPEPSSAAAFLAGASLAGAVWLRRRR